MNEIILRVLNGASSPEEDIKLMKWINEDDNNLQNFVETENLWNAVDIVLNRHRYNPEKAFADFKSKIQTSRGKKRQHASGSVKKLIITVLYRAALVIMLLSLGGLLGQLGLSYLGDEKPMCEVIVPLGARSNIKLPDGTNVWLNAESRLQYAQNFNTRKRTVFLTGEGYFEVAENVNKPFVVKASEIEITALGTIFNVKSYPEEKLVQTTLIEGLVIIKGVSDSKRINTVILEPNQQAVYFKDSVKISSIKKPEVQNPLPVKSPDIINNYVQASKIILNKQVDANAVIAWKDNSLMFSNETFKSIAIKLERRFDVEILFNDEEVMNFHFSGRFDNISIEQALGALKYASPLFNYSIEKDVIYITRK